MGEAGPKSTLAEVLATIAEFRRPTASCPPIEDATPVPAPDEPAHEPGRRKKRFRVI